MIHRVSSTLKSFKEIAFRPGLNLIVAEKSEGATDLQTRNSCGKSSLIEVIHFLLGASCDRTSIFRRDSIANEHFSLTFDLRDLKLSATRRGATSNRVVVDSSSASWPAQPRLTPDGEAWLSNATQWRPILAHEIFGISSDEDETYGPKFRSLISYFIRREANGGFQDTVANSSKQQPWDRQVNLAFLLDLDWQIPQAVQRVRLREKSLATLRKEVKTGILGSLVGKTGELRSRFTVAERDLRKLQTDIARFRVLPEYEELEREASRLAVELSELANENALDQQRIESVERQMRDEHVPEVPDVEQVYAEAGVVFSNLVTKNLANVRRFHEAIVRNRMLHLADEVESAKRRIAARRVRSQQMDSRRVEIIETLSSHGALDQLNRLQAELSRRQADVEELRKRLDLAKQVESTGTELTIQRAHLRQRLAQDLDEHAEVLNDAVVLFEEFSRQISDHEGTLTVEPTDNGPQFGISVEGERSRGIRCMQTFCFDLMLAVLWRKKDMGPGFLIHDSHLFDGMDSRQVANSLELGAEQAARHGIQYIVTINSDQLASAEFSAEFDRRDYVNPVQLSDKYESGDYLVSESEEPRSCWGLRVG